MTTIRPGILLRRCDMLSDGAKQKLEFLIKIVYYTVIAVLIYTAYRFIDIILPFVLAFIMVAILQPPIRWMHRKLKRKQGLILNKKIPSVILIAVIYVGAGTLLVFLIYQLVFMLKDFVIAFPDYYRNTVEPLITNGLGTIDNWLSTAPPEWKEVYAGIRRMLVEWLQNAVGFISQKGATIMRDLFNGIPGSLLKLLFTILLSFFIGTQYDSVTQFLRNQVPKRIALSFSDVMEIMKNTLAKYLKAQFILMAITFVEVLVGLFVIGAPNPVAFAALIAVFDLLPVLGPGGVIIPWTLIELLQGNVYFAVGLIVLYIIITVVRSVVEPKVVGSQLGMHPILALLSIYVGYRLFGLFGMIVLPMVLQVLLAMHKKGNIRLFKEKPLKD